ncbi:MAG: lipopolysaccharide biosynthesis protein [Kiritimatiellae bacterium]|nr:lipopolysaccharide biosynthesis protein [Kiritimatiellia bacterium]
MKTENLRQRAYLNTVASWVDVGANMLVEFFLKPIIISLLGVTVYGIWQVIGQMNSYMATVDLRSGTSLKWYVAQNRTSLGQMALKKAVTAAVLANLFLLPLYLLAGAIIIWLAPAATQAQPEFHFIIRLATSLLVIGFVFNQYAFLLQSILAGMNLTFKRMGFKALITILSGVATVAVLYAGHSLPAMALVGIAMALVSGVTYWWILKQNVEWFGFARVSWTEIKGFFGLTVKFMASKTVNMINESSDYVLLGYFAGPQFVTSYAVTRYLVRATSKILGSINSAVTPGIGGFVGEGKLNKLFEARKILITVNWVAITVSGCVILVWNRSFLSLWVGGELFAGTKESLLIVVIASLKLLKNIDGSMIVMTLNIWKQNIVTGVIGVATIVLASILVPHYETLGLLIAIGAGTLVMALAYSILAQNNYHTAGFVRQLFVTRKSAVCTLLLLLASFAGARLEVHTWMALIGVAAATVLFVVICIWLFALNKKDKEILISNCKRVRFAQYKEA